jgi:hypothetical protein
MKFKKNKSAYSTTQEFLYPEAFITVNKNRVKVYSEGSEKNIFFKDKTNFEIELFNPTSERYMAKLWLNNKLISASGIVINPGQRVYLERFIDTSNKFLFETFKVDDVEETAAARETNGKVKVAFYSEVKYQQPYYFQNTNTFYTNTIGLGGGTSTPRFENYSGTPNISGTTTVSGTKLSLTSMDSLLSEPNQTETGRVSEGKKSNQEFKSTTGDFSNYASYYNYYHLLPESLKVIEANEIRNYCAECGFRQKKSSWKFCPNCGTEL